jgi:hypothetical protein
MAGTAASVTTNERANERRGERADMRRAYRNRRPW